MVVKQLKGKGSKHELHAHLHDFMGKKSRSVKSRSTYMVLLVKKKKKKSNKVSHTRHS